MAYFHTTVLDNQIKALPTVSTASGSIATFDTDMTENLIEVKCQILAKQEGSGTPSPSNPRPITVYTSLNLSHSGADTSNPNVTNIPFGQTVANGVINVTTGKLEITWGVVDLSTLPFSYDSGSKRWQVTLSGVVVYPTRNGDIYAEKYVGDITANVGDEYKMFTVGGALYIYYTDSTTPPTGKLVYPLATPQVIQLSATQITALLNENNIWCDTGDTEVKYLLTVGKKIS